MLKICVHIALIVAICNGENINNDIVESIKSSDSIKLSPIAKTQIGGGRIGISGDSADATNFVATNFTRESISDSTDSANNSIDSTHSLTLNNSADSLFDSTDSTRDSTQSRIDSAHDSIDSTDSTQSPAISLLYGATLGYFLDNTEEVRPFWEPRTIHAISASLWGGIRVEDYSGGAHSIALGGYGAQFMGAKHGFNGGGGIYAYYNYAHTGGFGAYLGIFPRKVWITTYPRSFFRDDFLFLNPTINGALLQYKSDSSPAIKGYAEATLDYFGASLKERRDEFYALFSGEIKIYETLIFGAQGALYHHQNSRITLKDGKGTHLIDRILYSVHLGLDLRGVSAGIREQMDVLELRIALLGQSERKRAIDGLMPTYHGVGGEISAKVQYKGFAVEDIYYFGKGQMRYFGDYGERFYDGLPLYQGAFNTIAVFYEYKNDFLRVGAGFRFYNIGANLRHFAHQQFVSVSFDTSAILKPLRLN